MQTGRQLLRAYLLGSLMLGPILLTAGMVVRGTPIPSLVAALSLGAALATLFRKMEQQSQIIAMQREMLDELKRLVPRVETGLRQ